MDQSQRDSYAPNRSFAAGKVVSNYTVAIVLIGVALGLAYAIHVHERATTYYDHGFKKAAPLLGVALAFVLIGVMWLVLYLVARRIKVTIDKGSGTITVVNLLRNYRFGVGDIERVATSRFVQWRGKKGVHYYYPCLQIVPASKGADQARGRRVFASISPGTASPLLDAISVYCTEHSIPCTIDGMVFDDLDAEQARLFELRHKRSGAGAAGATSVEPVDD